MKFQKKCKRNVNYILNVHLCITFVMLRTLSQYKRKLTLIDNLNKDLVLKLE